MNIGIFDSGFGGLDIMKSITELLPTYNYVYLGDSARTPYGTRSQEIIYTYTEQAVDFLFKKNCKLVIIACNSASAEALRKIQHQWLPRHYPKRNVLGVIIPSVEEAVEKSKNRRIGVIATEGSVSSKAFIREIKKLDNSISVFQQACPLLVPLVESGEKDTKIIKPILKKYIDPLLKKHIATLILGCTHYGFLEKHIRRYLKIKNKKVAIINQSHIIAGKLKDYLTRHPEYERPLTKRSKRIFYTTDITNRFRTLGSTFYGKPIQPKKISIP